MNPSTPRSNAPIMSDPSKWQAVADFWGQAFDAFWDAHPLAHTSEDDSLERTATHFGITTVDVQDIIIALDPYAI